MNIKINFRSDQPIYLQIVDQIRHLITSGELKQGDQLPTVRQLATELRVNFNTVARAYRLLDEARLISTQQGRGTYIWEAPDQANLERLQQEELVNLSLRYIEEVQRIGFDPQQVEEEILKQIDAWRQGKQNLAAE